MQEKSPRLDISTLQCKCETRIEWEKPVLVLLAIHDTHSGGTTEILETQNGQFS